MAATPPSPPSGGAPAGIPLLTPPPIPGIEQLKKDLTASVDYLVALTAIMIWDVISTFPSEFRYVWKAPWSHLKVLFLLNRYGSLVLQILNMSLVVANVSPQFCRKFFWFTPFVGTYVLTLCGAIFALHVWKLYDRSPVVGGVLVGALCGMLATMASNGAQFTHVEFSPAAQQFLDFYGCIAAGKPGKSIAPTILFWAAPFAFSLVLLFMALHHSLTTRRNSNGKELSVVSVLLRDGIWYLSVAATVNLVSVVLASQTANPNLHNFNAAASISFNFVMASRLLLSTFTRAMTLTGSNSLSNPSRNAAGELNHHHHHHHGGVGTPRFNPTFPPSNHFATGGPTSWQQQQQQTSPSVGRVRNSARRRQSGPGAPDSPLGGGGGSDDEKFDHTTTTNLDLEVGGGGGRRGRLDATDDDDEEEAMFDELPFPGGGGGRGVEGGGVEMERKCSEATLAGDVDYDDRDSRSFKSKAFESDGGTLEHGTAIAAADFGDENASGEEGGGEGAGGTQVIEDELEHNLGGESRNRRRGV